MFRGGQVIAVENAGLVARNVVATNGAQFPLHREGTLKGVGNQPA